MSTVPARPAPTRQNVLARYPLAGFFVMAYAFTWIVMAPWTLGGTGAGWLPVTLGPVAAGLAAAVGIAVGPTLAAVIMAAATEGGAGVRRLLARLLLWRVGLRWYVIAIVGVQLVMILSFALYSAASRLAALGGPGYLLSYIGVYVVVALLGGPLFEEIGWRGFALPRMQPRYGPLVASIFLGVLWALWHLPQFLVPSWANASGGATAPGMTLFLLSAVTLSVVTSWVFNNTQGSLLLAVLVHASFDAVTLPLGAVYPAASTSLAPVVVGTGVVALALIVFTRGGLGYRGEPAEASATVPLAGERG